MRFNRFILCAAAAMALLASCNEKDDPTSGEASLTLKSEAAVKVDSKSQSFDIEFVANRDWTAKAGTDDTWLQIDPASGSASSDVQKVTVTVKPNDSYERNATITISIGVTSKKVALKQEGNGSAPDGTKDNPFDIASAIAKCVEIGTTASTEEYYVKGIISKITEISTSFGNATFYLSDDGSTTLDQFYVYHVLSFNGEKFVSEDQIKVGDEVVVKGKLINYYGNTPEMTQGGQLVSVNGGQEVSYLSVEEPNEVSSEAGELTLNVSSNQSWTASTESTWLTVSPTSGENDGTVVLKYEANSGDARSAEVIFEGNKGRKKTVTLNQVAAGEQAFTVITWEKADWTEKSGEISLAKGEYTIVVKKNNGKTSPVVRDNGDIRSYAEATIEVSCNTEMTNIEFILAKEDPLSQYSEIKADQGTVGAQSNTDEKLSWTGSSSKVVFTVGSENKYGTNTDKSSGQFRFSAIRIK